MAWQFGAFFIMVSFVNSALTYLTKEHGLGKTGSMNVNNCKRTGIGLIRFSTGRQELGSSLERQAERCRSECERRGWDYDEKLCITQLGVSAFNGKNFEGGTALARFFEAARAGLLPPNPVLVIENPDRFSRAKLSQAEAKLWELVEDCNVEVLFLSLGGDPLTRGDRDKFAKRAIPMLEFERAHNESQRKSDLISAAVRSRVKAALEGKKIRFGRWQPAWIDFIGPVKEPGVFRENKRADVIREIVHRYLKGHSMMAIALDLNRRNIPTLMGGAGWSQAKIQYFLRCESLIGNATISGQKLKGYYPAIITEGDWNELQAKLAENNKRRGGGEEIQNLFRNHCFCKVCGGNVKSHRGGAVAGQFPYYYECANARRGQCSARAMVRISAVEEDFFCNVLCKNPATLLQESNPTSRKRLTELEGKIIQLQKENENLIRLARKHPENGAIDKQITEIETELKDTFLAHKTETRKIQISTAGPTAYTEIMKALGQWKGLPSLDAPGAGQVVADLVAAHETLLAELQNNETRKKILPEIPKLIQGLVIDLEERRYAARLHNDKLGEWRRV